DIGMCNRISTSAVLAIAVVAAVAGALVVRQGAVLGQTQQRDAEQAQLLQDRIRQLEAQRVDEDKKPDGTPKLQTKPQRWEYRVLTLAEPDDIANREMAKLTDDGWDYVGIVQQATPQHGAATGSTFSALPGTPTRVLFKRIK